MTAWSLLHLAVAGACFVLAFVHAASWLAVRSQRVQLWLSASCFAFGLLALATALVSRDAADLVEDPRPWLLLSVVPSIPLPYTLLRTAWALLDQPLTKARRIILGVGVCLGAARVVEVSTVVARLPEGTRAALEDVSRQTTSFSLPLFWLLVVLVLAAWAIEGVRLLRRRGAMAVSILATAVVSLGLLGRELAVDLRWIEGPTLFAMIGVPFILFASSALAIMTARALLGADLGSGVHRYRRLARLGKGGMGEVWLALRTGRAGFQRLVVLKRMLADDGEPDPAVRLHRFLGEARTAARLHHPNIISVHDLGQIEGGWFIVMEYLSGVSALELSRNPVPPEVVVEIGVQACLGLAYAHQREIVHRDVSSDNLVVTFDGVVKLVDFGIAQTSAAKEVPVRRNASLPPPSRMTQVGWVVGKTPYMPPERLEGAVANVSGDLYALGCVLHELLAGDLPGRDDNLSLHPFANVPKDRAVPAPLRALVERVLSDDVAPRPRTAEELLHALQEVRRALPPVDLPGWMKARHPERWSREQKLSELSAPTPEEVVPLLTGPTEAVMAPGARADATTEIRQVG